MMMKVNEELKGKNIKEVLEMTNLDWTVRQENLYLEDGTRVPNTRINIRNDNDMILGIVTERYTPVNNEVAFDFINELLKNDIDVENAGEIYNGKSIFLQTKLNDVYADCYEQNIDCKLIFTNSHDGKGSIKVNVVPIINGKVLNLKLKHQKRSWNAMHTKSIEKRMDNAKNTLSFAHSYFEELIKETNRLKDIKFTAKQKNIFIENMFPMKNDLSERTCENIEECRESLNSYIKENTALSFITGTAEYISKLEPKRKTKNFEQNKFANIINGYYLLDRAYEIINNNI